jgi:hypothetical protein
MRQNIMAGRAGRRKAGYLLVTRKQSRRDQGKI